MTKLDCNVTTCMHNADNCCCKNAIIVDGHSAKDKCDTCCGSFDESKDSSFHNVFKTPESKLEKMCIRDRHDPWNLLCADMAAIFCASQCAEGRR